MGAEPKGPAGLGGVVILGGRSPSTNIVYRALAPSFDIRAIIQEQRRTRGKFLTARVRHLGVVRVLGQLLFRFLLVPYLTTASRERQAELLREHGLDDSPIGETVTHVSSVNSDETISRLQALRPAVVVVNGTRIISARVLESIPAAFINMHAGITPRYRGVHGGYWSLVEGNREACGVTVHRVDTGIDTGPIIDQAVITPSSRDNFVTYPLLQLVAGLPLLQRAVEGALEGRLPQRPPPPGQSKLWSHPTLWGYLWHWIRRGVR